MTKQLTLGEPAVDWGADLSECGRYRYRLWRYWDLSLPEAVFIMLNPSTADASVDDPTIRKCVGFAKRWNCGGIIVVNLFALRSTDPRGLRRVDDPIGPDNDRFIIDAARAAALTVAAWGNHGWYQGRDEQVLHLLRVAGVELHRLGELTGPGHPRHPLMPSYATPLVPWGSDDAVGGS